MGGGLDSNIKVTGMLVVFLGDEIAGFGFQDGKPIFFPIALSL